MLSKGHETGVVRRSSGASSPEGSQFSPDDMSATPDPSHFLPVERTRQTLMKARAFAAQRYCRRQFAAYRR